MKKILIFVLLGIFLLNLVYADDTQLHVGCGGDDEMMIGCLGDEDLTFFSGGVSAQVQGQSKYNQVFMEKEEISEPTTITSKFNNFLKSKGFSELDSLVIKVIFGGILFFFIIMIFRERKKKKEKLVNPKYNLPNQKF